MIDWEALRKDMPRIVEQLKQMMIDEALRMMLDNPTDILAWPAVEIGYASRDGETFKVRLSIEERDEEEDELT